MPDTAARLDPIARLLARDQHGIKFGLDSIRTLCDALGHPERAYHTLLVAGTNGKGSVTAMTATALTAAGYRTGRYTSPHLTQIEERFVIDGVPTATAALRDAAAAVLQSEASCLNAGRLAAPVTFFEITTATGFELFRRARADIVVLEVGMGGRFDATNVADPAAVAITSIARDHERFLGSGLDQIAFEKAGVIRAARPCVVGPSPAEADAVIRRIAEERQAHLIGAAAGVDALTTLSGDGRTIVALRTPAHDYGPLTLGLRGRHQVDNAVVAVRLLESLHTTHLDVPPAAIALGLEQVSWPGRLDARRAPDGRRILLDAAHNPAGVSALSQYLVDVRAPRLPVLFGAMRDKDVEEMLRILAPRASRFVMAQADTHRAMAAGELALVAARVAPDLVVDEATDPLHGLQLAFAHAPMVIAAGSIFLIGALLPALSGWSAPPLPAPGPPKELW